MPTLLRDKMSSEAHINNSERHVRLCQQTQGTESLIANIHSKIADLQVKMQNRTDKVKARYSAYDGIVFKDGMLDDCIKDLAGSAKQYDRNHPGRPIFNRLFPDGRPSSITEASFKKELNKAEQLGVRLQLVSGGTSLESYNVILTDAIEASRQAILDHQSTITEEKLAITAEEMAQRELRQQYEFNSLDAAKLFGKNFANRLFPNFANKKKRLVEETAVEA